MGGFAAYQATPMDQTCINRSPESLQAQISGLLLFFSGNIRPILRLWGGNETPGAETRLPLLYFTNYLNRKWRKQSREQRKGKRQINWLSVQTVPIEDLENPKIETLGNTKFFLQN